ncbi:hypothetical protein [Halogeometricum limi]|uniref:Glycine zipper domain-containing protein n=1 Tax=Halogeometricum limi TaxID=555875 RepID=A0A1I6IDS2_9EURY|nr:hypothetical protein [Halogeometricum limi]SFR64833.1 hypothetical protein SAMN04488124_3102 [Halogeometricum limi]
MWQRNVARAVVVLVVILVLFGAAAPSAVAQSYPPWGDYCAAVIADQKAEQAELNDLIEKSNALTQAKAEEMSLEGAPDDLSIIAWVAAQSKAASEKYDADIEATQAEIRETSAELTAINSELGDCQSEYHERLRAGAFDGPGEPPVYERTGSATEAGDVAPESSSEPDVADETGDSPASDGPPASERPESGEDDETLAPVSSDDPPADGDDAASGESGPADAVGENDAVSDETGAAVTGGDAVSGGATASGEPPAEETPPAGFRYDEEGKLVLIGTATYVAARGGTSAYQRMRKKEKTASVTQAVLAEASANPTETTRTVVDSASDVVSPIDDATDLGDGAVKELEQSAAESRPTAKPNATKPAVTKPVVTKPRVSKPYATKPSSPKLSVQKPPAAPVANASAATKLKFAAGANKVLKPIAKVTGPLGRVVSATDVATAYYEDGRTWGEHTSKASGKALGGMAGAAIGAAVLAPLGPFGLAVGAVAGGIIGETVGEGLGGALWNTFGK